MSENTDNITDNITDNNTNTNKETSTSPASPTSPTLQAPLSSTQANNDDNEDTHQHTNNFNKEVVDIEHLPVKDDPRDWGWYKKHAILVIVTWALVAVSFAANIYFPALDNLQRDLNASNQIISLSVSLYAIIQGITPLAWAALAELWGRKIVYLVSMAIFTASNIVISRATTPAIFLAFRSIAAIGSAAVAAIGAGTLADIFEAEVRGRKLGIYYVAPLIGPSIGNILGGALTTAADWRSTFYFVTAVAGSSFISFIFMPDTFRKERSLTWRAAYQRVVQATKDDQEPPSFEDFKPSFRDVNPFSAIGRVLKNTNVVGALLLSSIFYGAQYSIFFTASSQLPVDPWNYSPIIVGLVLVAYGVGQIFGSVGGGRFSDYMLIKLTKENNGVRLPEFRIRSIYFMMPVVVLSVAVVGWALQKGWHVAALCIILIICGLSNIWCFSSLLAFQVDSAVGSSTTAVACNSAARGIMAFVATEIAGPIYRKVGQGPLYTGWAIVILLAELGLIATIIYTTKKRRKDAVAPVPSESANISSQAGNIENADKQA